MNHKLIYPLAFALTFSSCQTNMGTGIITGGVIGGGIGGVLGGGTGGLIGATAGIITGGLIGTILDTQDRKVMERSSPRTINRMDRGDPLTINDVIKLSQGGVSDDAIIHYMEEAETQYHLSQTQIRRLRDEGVSQRVIHFMVESGK